MNMCSDTTITQDDCTMEQTDRDTCILTMMDEVGGMVYNFSYKFGLEYDDCIQQAAFIMLKVWPKIPAHVANKKAYLHSCVRRELYQLLQRNIDTLSLDEARTEDGATFLDMLQAYEQKRSEDELAYLEKMSEVVHAALRECHLEEQEYATMAFGLPDYTPVPPVKPRVVSGGVKTIKPRRTDNMLTSIKRVFRKNPHVQGLLQREKCLL